MVRWALDEGLGTTIVDSTLTGNTGTVLSGAAWITGTPFASTPLPAGNYGLHLKGTSTAADYVSFGPSASLGTPAFTVETWFMRDGNGGTTTTGTGGLAPLVPPVPEGRKESEARPVGIHYFLG